VEDISPTWVEFVFRPVFAELARRNSMSGALLWLVKKIRWLQGATAKLGVIAESWTETRRLESMYIQGHCLGITLLQPRGGSISSFKCSPNSPVPTLWNNDSIFEGKHAPEIGGVLAFNQH
jgi:hypothetical protein